MQTEIDFVDNVLLQNELNSNFGENIFIVFVDKSDVFKKFYLQYEDSVPENLVNEAIELANTQHEEFIKRAKIKLYSRMNDYETKFLESYSNQIFSDEDIQSATEWLNNQTLPVPLCVSYTALSNNMTNEEAANYIINSKIKWQNFCQELNNLKIQGQQIILTLTDFSICKQQLTDIIDQMRTLN